MNTEHGKKIRNRRTREEQRETSRGDQCNHSEKT